MRRFPRQPFVLAMRQAVPRWSYRDLAGATGVPVSHVVCAARGSSAPSPQLRTKLCELFQCDLDELFTPDALAATYDAARAERTIRAWSRS
jgi:transcriptional regulator with XRE-family HTH domain